jgi:hypothetical protein
MKNNPPLVLEAIDEFSGQQEWLINIGSDKVHTNGYKASPV